jgi:hypothetical protein
MRIAASFALALALASPLAAQNAADYDRLLLPVFFFGAGAHGSLWTTSVTVTNNGTTDADMAQAIFGDAACPTRCGCGLIRVIKARSAAVVCDAFTTDAGLFVYVPKATRDALNWNVRIADTSRSSATAGTEVAVADLSKVGTNGVVLPAVLTGANYRTALRIYGLNDGDTGIMRIFDVGNLTTPRAERNIQLANPIRDIIADPFPSRPAFLFIPDLAAAVPELGAGGTWVIEIIPHAPVDPGPPVPTMWALASTTNNDTQQVTTVTPQRR